MRLIQQAGLLLVARNQFLKFKFRLKSKSMPPYLRCLVIRPERAEHALTERNEFNFGVCGQRAIAINSIIAFVVNLKPKNLKDLFSFGLCPSHPHAMSCLLKCT